MAEPGGIAVTRRLGPDRVPRSGEELLVKRDASDGTRAASGRDPRRLS
jgi:hypothetical protein